MVCPFKVSLVRRRQRQQWRRRQRPEPSMLRIAGGAEGMVLEGTNSVKLWPFFAPLACFR